MPYDRDNTTMQDFSMCGDCLEEYHNLGDRRYHAEANACPVCGPQVYLYKEKQKINVTNPILEAQNRLKKGEIGVIKGLGGFHLACDAQNREAVSRIKNIKKEIKALCANG